MIVTNRRCPRAGCNGVLWVETIEYGAPMTATCLACGREYAEVRPVKQSKGKRRPAA